MQVGFVGCFDSVDRRVETVVPLMELLNQSQRMDWRWDWEVGQTPDMSAWTMELKWEVGQTLERLGLRPVRGPQTCHLPCSSDHYHLRQSQEQSYQTQVAFGKRRQQ